MGGGTPFPRTARRSLSHATNNAASFAGGMARAPTREAVGVEGQREAEIVPRGGGGGEQEGPPPGGSEDEEQQRGKEAAPDQGGDPASSSSLSVFPGRETARSQGGGQEKGQTYEDTGRAGGGALPFNTVTSSADWSSSIFAAPPEASTPPPTQLPQSLVQPLSARTRAHSDGRVFSSFCPVPRLCSTILGSRPIERRRQACLVRLPRYCRCAVSALA